MEQFALYLVLKDIINNIDNSYSCSFNDINFTKPLRCGIYIKGSDISTYRAISNGQYYNYCNRVQILLQGNTSEDALLQQLTLASKIRDTLITTFNVLYKVNTVNKYAKIYHNIDKNNMQVDRAIDKNNISDTGDVVDSNEQSLYISAIHLLGEVDFKGKMQEMLPRYSINFKIYYTLRRE